MCSYLHPGGSPAGRPTVERNPSAIKQMLLDWCKTQCQGYEVGFLETDIITTLVHRVS